VSRDAVDHYVKTEWAESLCDVMIRRSSWRYYHRDHREIAETVAGWMAELLGWSPDTTTRELDAYDEVVQQTAVRGSPAARPEPRPRAAQVQIA
jgi:glycerol-3-phosphate dehydrogenase